MNTGRKKGILRKDRSNTKAKTAALCGWLQKNSHPERSEGP